MRTTTTRERQEAAAALSPDMLARAVLLLLLLLVLQQTRPCDSTRSVGRCDRPLEQCRGKKWQHDSLCSPDKQCVVATERRFSFQIVVKMRSARKEAGAKKKVGSLWMRGSGPGLSWEKPVELRRSGASVDSWRTKIGYRSSSDALLCTARDYCTYNQKAVEFRFYRDQQGKEDMVGPNFYLQLPVSESMEGSASFLTPTITVFPWFDGRKVTVRQYELTSSFHSLGLINMEDHKTTLDVIFPPSFEYNVRKRYPLVLYLGYDARAFAPLLELAYVHEALTREAVVVGVRPLDEKPPYTFLSPYRDSGWWYCPKTPCEVKKCATCWLPRTREDACDKTEFTYQSKNCMPFSNDRESYGEMFLDFIELDVLPKVREVTQERVEVEFPKHRLSIFGEFDATSLLACHAALTRPHIYQNAACFSAPFYWPLHSPTKVVGEVQQVFQRLRRQFEKTPALRTAYLSQKYYIDISFNQQAVVPVVDAYKHTDDFVERLKDTLYLEEGRNIVYFTVPDIAVAPVMRESGSKGAMMVYDRFLPALRFFLPAEGGPNRKAARIRAVADKTIAEHSELYGGLVQNSNNSSPADEGSCDAHYVPPGVSRPTEVPILFFLPILGLSVSFFTMTCITVCMYRSECAVGSAGDSGSDVSERCRSQGRRGGGERGAGTN